MILQKIERARGHALVDCSNCGTEVATVTKCWTRAPAKYRVIGDIQEFRVGIFKCPKCKSKFRSKVDATTKSLGTSVKDLTLKIKEICEGFTQTLRTLQEKIRKLETERAGLLVEMEERKKVAES